MDHVRSIVENLRKYNDELKVKIGKWEEILNGSRKLTEGERKIVMEKDIGKEPTPIRTMGLLKPYQREYNERMKEKYEKSKKEWEEKNADLI